MTKHWNDYQNNLIGGGYLGLLMTKPWNEHFAAKCFGIERIFGWKEVPAIIEEYERRVRSKL